MNLTCLRYGFCRLHLDLDDTNIKRPTVGQVVFLWQEEENGSFLSLQLPRASHTMGEYTDVF